MTNKVKEKRARRRTTRRGDRDSKRHKKKCRKEKRPLEDETEIRKKKREETSHMPSSS